MTSEDNYILTRDFLENSRLNLFHYQWVEVFGYRTHPKIPIDGPKLRLADIGAGTGVWLTDLAARLPPSVQLDGLDVSLRAMPPKEWLPSNMTVREWDIKSEVPNDLVGVYDIVHARNFIFVLKNDEIKDTMAKMMKLLKPGGYLQWGESEIYKWKIMQSNPQGDASALGELMSLTLGQDARLQATWISNIAEYLTEAGFEDVETDLRDPQPHLAFMMHECQLVLHELITRQTRNESVRKEVQRLLPLVEEQTVAGASTDIPRRNVIGKKPKVGD
ncbi:S-adenosyl-L-methionine-dependent methyltransferase [Hypoxylon sp. FL1150]|nr:S-adenosyl-L-methionine-dependent methyltransferase [Hypoxylon sp. FL1150]